MWTLLRRFQQKSNEPWLMMGVSMRPCVKRNIFSLKEIGEAHGRLWRSLSSVGKGDA
jgi:hypothetical protein